jgi:hypothetical protein
MVPEALKFWPVNAKSNVSAFATMPARSKRRDRRTFIILLVYLEGIVLTARSDYIGICRLQEIVGKNFSTFTGTRSPLGELDLC